LVIITNKKQNNLNLNLYISRSLKIGFLENKKQHFKTFPDPEKVLKNS